MTQKQYEAAQIIMQCSRIFANSMRECLKNSGLIDEGYQLRIRVGQPWDVADGMKLLGSIDLDRDSNFRKDCLQDAFSNYHFEQEGWVVIDDPVIKSGTVPPVVCMAKKGTRPDFKREETKPATVSDSLWFSIFDDHGSVVGGM